MADFQEPDACYELSPPKLAPLPSDAPTRDGPLLTPEFSSSSDGGTRRIDPIEAHRLFRGMYDDNTPPPSTVEKLTDPENLKRAGMEQAKQDALGKRGLQTLSAVKEAIRPSPPLGTPAPVKKSGPLDFTFSISPGAPSIEELRKASLANPDKQTRTVDEPRPLDAGRTPFYEEQPDGGVRRR